MRPAPGRCPGCAFGLWRADPVTGRVWRLTRPVTGSARPDCQHPEALPTPRRLSIDVIHQNGRFRQLAHPAAVAAGFPRQGNDLSALPTLGGKSSSAEPRKLDKIAHPACPSFPDARRPERPARPGNPPFPAVRDGVEFSDDSSAARGGKNGPVSTLGSGHRVAHAGRDAARGTPCTASSHLRNFGVVEDGVLYRSGQLNPPGLKRVLADYRIKTW